MSEKYLIEVQDLQKYFTKTSGFFGKNEKHIKAVDNVTLLHHPQGHYDPRAGSREAGRAPGGFEEQSD